MLTQTPATFRGGSEMAFPVGAGDLPRRAKKRPLAGPRRRRRTTRALGDCEKRCATADTRSTKRATRIDGPCPVRAGRHPDVVLLDLRLPDCGDLRLLDTVCASRSRRDGHPDDGVRHAGSARGGAAARCRLCARQAVRRRRARRPDRPPAQPGSNPAGILGTRPSLPRSSCPRRPFSSSTTSS